MKRRFVSLTLSMVLIILCTSSAWSYTEPFEDFLNTGDCYTFYIDEMQETENGIYEFSIPLNVYDTSTSKGLLTGAPIDSSGEHTVTLSFKYEVNSKELSTSIYIDRVHGTSKIKSANALFSYTIYKNAEGLEIAGIDSKRVEKSFLVPLVSATVTKVFKNVEFDKKTQYITVRVDGTFTLVDGAGFYQGEATTLPQ